MFVRARACIGMFRGGLSDGMLDMHVIYVIRYLQMREKEMSKE